MPSALKILSSDESRKLLEYLLTKPRPKFAYVRNQRDYTIALIMLDAGLRVGECTQLLVSDLWFGNEPVKTLLIRSEIAKNNRERIVPLTNRIRQALFDMDKMAWSKSTQTGLNPAFFCHCETQNVTVRRVQQIIKDAAICSIGRPIHPHTLRHTFATRLMQKTSIRVVQQLLGHSSISSTQVYTHPNSEDLTIAISSLNAPTDFIG